jgi:hypothetical protein
MEPSYPLGPPFAQHETLRLEPTGHVCRPNLTFVTRLAIDTPVNLDRRAPVAKAQMALGNDAGVIRREPEMQS